MAGHGCLITAGPLCTPNRKVMDTSTLPLPQAVLTVQDLPRAVSFYTQQLGFMIADTDAPPGLASLTAPDGAHLVLAAADTPTTAWPGVPRPQPGAWIYIHCTGLPALAAYLAARGVAFHGPETPYAGCSRLSTVDPDGYAVVFWTAPPLSDAEMLEIYRTGPARLSAAVADLDTTALDRRWAPGKWTIRMIVHHLVDAELGVLPVLHLALADPGHRFQPNLWDADRVAAGLQHQHRPVAAATAMLAAVRAWVVEILAHLPDGLDRHVLWPSGGRAEVRQLLRHLGGHTLHHITQIQIARSASGLPPTP